MRELNDRRHRSEMMTKQKTKYEALATIFLVCFRHKSIYKYNCMRPINEYDIMIYVIYNANTENENKFANSWLVEQYRIFCCLYSKWQSKSGNDWSVRSSEIENYNRK